MKTTMKTTEYSIQGEVGTGYSVTWFWNFHENKWQSPERSDGTGLRTEDKNEARYRFEEAKADTDVRDVRIIKHTLDWSEDEDGEIDLAGETTEEVS